MSDLGDRIAAKRRTSKAALARAVGVDVKTLYRWELQGVEPEAKFIVPLADALGVSCRWLLTGRGPQRRRQ